MNNRGISAVVATVLIILITVAAISIIWVAVLPMLKERSSIDVSQADLSIDTSSGYTTYDSKNNLLGVQIKRGSDEINYSFVQIIIGIEGNSKSYIKPAPDKNSARTFYFRVGSEPDTLKVAPVDSVIEGRVNDAGVITSEVEIDKAGSISEEDKEITKEEGVIEDLECAEWDPDIGDYDYFSVGGLSRSGDYFCGAEGDYGECGLDSQCDDDNDCTFDNCTVSLTCENLDKPAGFVCDNDGEGGLCDGNGNCGECVSGEDCVERSCYSKTCNSGNCEYIPLSEGELCGGGICDGNGNCVISEQFCIWDFPEKSCSADDDGIDNLCSYGYDFGSGSTSQFKLIDLVEEEHILNMTFDIYYSCYAYEYEVFLNSVSLGSFETEDSLKCGCEPSDSQWPFTFYITNQDLLNNEWNFEGGNNISVVLNEIGTFAVQSYYELEIGYY